MRPPPPVGVSCPCVRSWRWAGALLAALTAAALGAWLAGWGAEGFPDLSGERRSAAMSATAALAGLTALLGARLSRPFAPIALRWDGASWTADGAVVDVEVMLDLGDWLLLRLTPAAGRVRVRRARWLPVTARASGAAWRALRTALLAVPPHATAKSDTGG